MADSTRERTFDTVRLSELKRNDISDMDLSIKGESKAR